MELFQRILDKLQTPNNESLKMSMNHCHVRGMFSLVVDGDEFGHTCYLIGKATYTSVGGAKKTVRHYTVNSVEALRSLK